MNTYIHGAERDNTCSICKRVWDENKYYMCLQQTRLFIEIWTVWGFYKNRTVDKWSISI